MQLLALFGMVPTAGILLSSRQAFIGTDLTRGVSYAFVTGVLGNCGNFALLEALKHGGSAAIVYPLTGMFPLVTIILARLILNERLNLTQKLGCVISLVAIYMFSTGTEDAAAGSAVLSGAAREAPISWVLYSLLALALFGICGVTQKMAALHISSECSTLCWVAGSLPIALVIVLSGSPDWHVATRDWVISIAWGVLVVIGMIASFAAYHRGKAGVVTALIALYPALTATAAVLFFGEHLTTGKVTAVALALMAGILLTHEGTKQLKDESAAQ